MSPTPRSVITAGVVLPSFGTIAVILRFYVRKRKETRLGSDDWTILASLILTWFLGIVLIAGAAIGSLGGHTKINHNTGADVVTSREQNAVRLEFTFYLIMIPTFGLIKLSVLPLYRRLFVARLFKHYSFVMCALITLWAMSFFFATAFQCGGRIYEWWTSAKTIAEYCDRTAALELGFAVSDIVTDLMVLVIPLPIVWKLHMSKSSKIGLSGVFLLGFLSTAASIVRMVISLEDLYDTTTGFRDLRALISNVLVWSQVEAGVAIVATCLPTIRPLFLGKSPESLIGSIRSMMSLNSQGQKASRNFERHDSLSEALAASKVESGHRGYSKDHTTFETEISSDHAQNPEIGMDQIMMQRRLSQKEERLVDPER